MTGSDPPRGIFITMEGGEGGGKSTQATALVERLVAAGIDAIATREPGGSETAELIRSVLLDGTFEKLGPKIEALLFAAARIDHLDSRIKPALRAGTWVVSDRFLDSTRAYQGVVGAVDGRFLESLERISLEGVRPDLTIVLDLPARTGLLRAAARRGERARADRFERQTLEFHKKLRGAFLAIADRERERFAVIDATQSQQIVGREIWETVTQRLPLPQAAGRS